MVSRLAYNNRLERTASLLARARREHAVKLCALAPRMKRRQAAAQPERYAASKDASIGKRGGLHECKVSRGYRVIGRGKAQLSKATTTA